MEMGYRSVVLFVLVVKRERGRKNDNCDSRNNANDDDDYGNYDNKKDNKKLMIRIITIKDNMITIRIKA